MEADEGLGVTASGHPACGLGAGPHPLSDIPHISHLRFVKREGFYFQVKGIRHVHEEIGVRGIEAVEDEFLDLMGGEPFLDMAGKGEKVTGQRIARVQRGFPDGAVIGMVHETEVLEVVSWGPW